MKPKEQAYAFLIPDTGAFVSGGNLYNRHLIDALRERVAAAGPWAPLAYVLLRAGAALALLPGSVVTAVAAALFHPVVAIISVSIGKTLAAALAFLIARYVARDAVARWIERKEKARRLDELIAERGALVVALNRLVPVIPFSVQNYAFGLTRIRFGVYLFWSWLCMLPAAVLVVAGAAIIIRTLSTGVVPWELVMVLAVTVLVMVGLAIYAWWRLWVSFDPLWRKPNGGEPQMNADKRG